MKKAVLDKLTAALESAGFEIISLKEETGRHLLTEHDLRGDVYVLGKEPGQGGTCMETGWTLDFKSGVVIIEAAEIRPSVSTS
jgi:hypothetical protein